MNEKLIIRMTQPLEHFDHGDPRLIQVAKALGVPLEKLEQIATREAGRVIAQAKDAQHGAQVMNILTTLLLVTASLLVTPVARAECQDGAPPASE